MPATTRRLDQRRKENAHEGRSVMTNVKRDLDAVIIGAGFYGMYMLHSLRDKLDLKVTVFEAGDGVGGTWYWNRYPGARCDSDSYIYCYTFDKNLLQEWEWSERYPEQDEILRYLEHCAERFALKPDIQFGKRVVEVVFDDNSDLWTLRTEKGDTRRARFVSTALGALSAANITTARKADYDGIRQRITNSFFGF